MRYQYQINGKSYFFQADEALSTAAVLPSNTIKEQEEQYAVLQGGKLLQIGWNYFRILHFPVGTIAVFDHGQLVEAVGEGNKKLL